ncbi:UDP-N-acetylmuramoyl-L-alanyl-D-glutamate--2,6-diaminopimelate ligase [Helicobacter sp. 13S00477-4]|uniref:UDP-N-acetylmuramoyl-L-alanyl-D-glutamate--2, 6-diaminopimelate ligase n=1 Tax=Helicobacter sp. 13S00477-4 TaxID=1905759 RepID=UPI000BA645D7|nr:UDP-N-acetylmuramoyl-L-alanyl-D-glutamate--2,6-diaminopimelate ligase [Helicobacter sp. 13S00477-4]PAF51651.1 UDP-N-acetylmuramoyl-L-alanyl-D-glutamate--2,6-diaminopimelate ligase [Helicobacter sp. 13S00477-4]
MKIPKQIKYHSKTYLFLSDDSTEAQKDPNVLFLQTKRNASYGKTLKENGFDIVDANELKNYFLLTPKIIGITGTNGKTTTGAIIYSILLDMGYKCALLGTRGFFANDEELKPKGLTTPGILELYANIEKAALLDCEYFIMEVSSHAIEQERIAGLNFSAKILTNITGDHLDYHKTFEEYIRVKNSFFKDESLKIINKDEPKVFFNPKNAYGYALNSKTNLSPTAYSFNEGINAHIFWKENHNNPEEAFIDSCLYGVHNLYNILAAIACIKCLTKAPLKTIAKKTENFGGVSGRMEIVSHDPLIIVDFAHTEDGMKQIFESFKSKKISVVFGAGGDRDKTKRPKMGACAYNYAEKIYITSDNPRSEEPNNIIDEIFAGIPKNTTHHIILEPDRKKAIQQAMNELENNEVLLVLGKGDETYQIIGKENFYFDDREIIKNYIKQIKPL